MRIPELGARLLVAALAAFAVAGGPPGHARFRDGVAHAEAGRREEAKRAFREAAARDHVEAMVRLGELCEGARGVLGERGIDWR